MRAPKQGDSPSGFNREVYPIRPAGLTAGEIDRWLERVGAEIRRLVKQNPGLLGEDAGRLGSRTSPELCPSYGSALRRAALGVLVVRAVDRAEQARIDTGNDAA